MSRKDNAEATEVHESFMTFVDGLIFLLMGKIASEVFGAVKKIGMVTGHDSKEAKL
jgi:hypothetical protein